MNFNVDFEKLTQVQYESEVKQKKLEISNLQKQQLKPVVRLEVIQLGHIHLKYGFLNEAFVMYRKAFNESTTPIDQYNSAFMIALESYFGKIDEFLDDYSQHAIVRQSAKGDDFNVETTELLNLLNALSKQNDLSIMARQFANMDFGNLRDLNELKGCITMDEIAYYIVLTVLSSMPRDEIQENIMKNSSILTLLESNTYTQNVLENFLLGKYEEALKATQIIRQQLKWDQYFGMYGNNQVYKEIRIRTLQLYVKPYKVLDMREISKEFGIALDELEVELAQLITSGKIKCKIDSYQKLLISSQGNKQQDAYKKAVYLGDKFIRNTEDMLLKITLMQQNKILTHDDLQRLKQKGKSSRKEYVDRKGQRDAQMVDTS